MTNAPLNPDALRDFATAVYQSAGVPQDDAWIVADSLVQADLWGHQSHGLLRLTWYLARLRSGVMRAVTAPELVVNAGAIAVMDGGDGIGQVLAQRAADEAVARAKAHGVGAVAVRNSNHFGTAMYFTGRAARQGCVAFLSTNGSPAMAPWGGREKRIGNNPWSIAAPIGDGGVMVLDMANTLVARGKIYLAKQRGEKIPLDWAIAADGSRTDDPVAAIAGTLLPMGGHKGYGISVMMDMLSGVLSGSGFGMGVAGPYQADKRSGCGHLMIALDIAAFQPLPAFEARIQAQIAELKDAPRAPGVEEIFYPGELEARADLRQRRDGLILPADTLADLALAAQLTGVPAVT